MANSAGCLPANFVDVAGKKPKHRSAIIDRENRIKIILLHVSVLFTIVLIDMFLFVVLGSLVRFVVVGK